MGRFRTALIALSLGCSSGANAAELPTEIVSQLPPNYVVLSSATLTPHPAHEFYVVVVGSRKESKSYLTTSDKAPARPLLIYERSAQGRYVLTSRNDNVVLRADDAGIAGNGCDPFEERQIAVKGRYFTVEHGVACGAHWTDYITFRFDPASKAFVFDNWRFQSWSMNRSDDPNAEALVSDPPTVVRSKGKRIPFAMWQRPARE